MGESRSPSTICHSPSVLYLKSCIVFARCLLVSLLCMYTSSYFFIKHRHKTRKWKTVLNPLLYPHPPHPHPPPPSSPFTFNPTSLFTLTYCPLRQHLQTIANYHPLTIYMYFDAMSITNWQIEHQKLDIIFSWHERARTHARTHAHTHTLSLYHTHTHTRTHARTPTPCPSFTANDNWPDQCPVKLGTGHWHLTHQW
jgi:hypothetical protein